MKSVRKMEHKPLKCDVSLGNPTICRTGEDLLVAGVKFSV